MIGSNPMLGILLFMLGGQAGAVFYMPFAKVKKWAWESYWLIYAVVGMVLVPWVLALITSPNTLVVLLAAPRNEFIFCLACGMLWGFGGLTWGLMIRFLGVGLGLALGAGLTSITGTLIPPMLQGREAMIALLHTTSGQVSISVAAISLLGIVCVGLAGRSKEMELSAEAKKGGVAEFDMRKGIRYAVFSGLMSSAMSFGLQGGPSIQKLALSVPPTTNVTWSGIPVLVVVLLGGFLVNGAWCALLNIRNRSLGDYASKTAPIWKNSFYAAFAGAIWCFQFVCFKAGEPSMGKTSYIGWAVLMASAILCSQLLGILLGEWRGTSGKTKILLATGLSLLIASSALAGYAGSL